MKTAFRFLAITALALSGTAHASAIITQWNFNGTIGVNNAPLPSIGTGSATPTGMNGGANNADILNAGGTPTSSDPSASNQAWRVRGSQSNGWSGTTQLISGAQFNVSTINQENITVSMDILATDGSPRHAQFQYTTDGSTFTSFGALLDFNPTSDRWANGISFDLSSVAAVANNTNFGFRIVSAFSPNEFTNANGLQAPNTAFQRTDAGSGVYTGAAGNYRFDMVTVSGTIIPAPSAAALLGVVGLTAAHRRRR
jgi:hypothetical protein